MTLFFVNYYFRKEDLLSNAEWLPLSACSVFSITKPMRTCTWQVEYTGI